MLKKACGDGDFLDVPLDSCIQFLGMPQVSEPSVVVPPICLLRLMFYGLLWRSVIHFTILARKSENSSKLK